MNSNMCSIKTITYNVNNPSEVSSHGSHMAKILLFGYLETEEDNRISGVGVFSSFLLLHLVVIAGILMLSHRN